MISHSRRGAAKAAPNSPAGNLPASRGPFQGFDRSKLERERKAQQWREKLANAILIIAISIFALFFGAWATKAVSQAAHDAVYFQMKDQ